MTGLSIVVPPAMPQRSLLPRPSHSTSNAARNAPHGVKPVKSKGLNANSNAITPAAGRKERVTSRRACLVASCPNLIDPGWPWKQCKRCMKEKRGREVRKATNPRVVSVDVACGSCFAASAVPVNEIKVGQPYLCRPCRERNAALFTALPQPTATVSTSSSAPPRTIVMHDASPPPNRDVSRLGHGPPPVSQTSESHSSAGIHAPPPPPVPQGPFVPIPIASEFEASKGASSNFDAIIRFVHPDHRHILGYRDGLVPPPPPPQIAPAPAPPSKQEHMTSSAPPASPKEPPVKRVRLSVPHYSRAGEILAVLPEDVGLDRSRPPHTTASNAPPAAIGIGALETVNVAESESRPFPPPFAQSGPHPLETPRKVSVTHTQAGSIKLKIPPKHSPPPPVAPTPIPTPSDKSPNRSRGSAAASSSHTPASASGKKRKRPSKPANRICELPGCESVIPPRFKGSRCVQCGFARWSTVFRERFDGIRAELVQAGIAGACPAATVKERSGVEEDTPTIEEQKQPVVEGGASSAQGSGADSEPSDATVLSPQPAPSATQEGVAPRTPTVLPSAIPPPSVFRRPSVRSVKLIVSPRQTEPVDNTTSLDPGSSSSRADTAPSEAVDIPKPKIKSIKLRISTPPDSHTPSPDIPDVHTNDRPRLPTSPLTDLSDMDVDENEGGSPMDVGHDQEASDGDTTDSEASIPLAYRYAATGTKNTSPQLHVPEPAEADGPYPMDFDHDLEDHTGDTTESEASVPLADWAPSNIPSTTPRSASLPPIRRVRLILGPNPARVPSPSSSSSRESSPDLALSSIRPFSVRRRWEALGWDTDESDLTPIEDSLDEDEGESEIDLPESSDEDEGMGMADAGTRLSIVIPRRTEKPPVKHRWQCASPRCASLLAYGSFFKNCDACRKKIHLLRKQERQRERLEGAAPGKYDDSEFHIPPDADLTGYRRCSRQSCNHLIPPESQYRYRTCGPCRAQKRRQWWRRKGLEAPDEDASLRKSASASIMERAMADAVRTAAKEEGPATGTRKRHAVDGAGGEEGAAGEKLMEMPPYQHFAALLDSLRSRFSQFKAMQTRYVQLKALTGADSKPMVFNFDGEYSVVTDPSGGSVDDVVNTVIRNVQAALGLHFQPAAVHSGPEESVIASLGGVYVAKIPPLSKEPVTNTADSNPTPPMEASTPDDSVAGAPLEVTMAGELHICVAWDRRHKFFPGQRIMLRFRLVG